MIVRVINPASQMSISGVGPDAPVCVGQPVVAIVNTQGISCNPADVNASAKGLCDLCSDITYQKSLLKTSTKNRYRFLEHLTCGLVLEFLILVFGNVLDNALFCAS